MMAQAYPNPAILGSGVVINYQIPEGILDVNVDLKGSTPRAGSSGPWSPRR